MFVLSTMFLKRSFGFVLYKTIIWKSPTTKVCDKVGPWDAWRAEKARMQRPRSPPNLEHFPFVKLTWRPNPIHLTGRFVSYSVLQQKNITPTYNKNMYYNKNVLKFWKSECHQISWNITIFAADWFTTESNQLLQQKNMLPQDPCVFSNGKLWFKILFSTKWIDNINQRLFQQKHK
jgi:hypothetical protein